jgi:glutathione S-transferase
MKLYDFAHAPSPRRVRIFLAEKGITVPRVAVDLVKKEQFSPEYRRVNPDCTLPALELDDGTLLCESVAICRYFEEIHPDPPLFGRDAKGKAIVEMWNRRAELQGYLRVADVLRNEEPRFTDRALPGVEGGVPQIAALAERGRQALQRFYARLDAELAMREFVAGPDFTIADITAFVTVDFAARVKFALPPEFAHLGRWHRAGSTRPSANA